MWFIGVEVEQETSAPLPKKNPGSAPGSSVSSRQLNKDCLQTKRQMLAIEFAQKVATLMILIYIMNIKDCEKG